MRTSEYQVIFRARRSASSPDGRIRKGSRVSSLGKTAKTYDPKFSWLIARKLLRYVTLAGVLAMRASSPYFSITVRARSLFNKINYGPRIASWQLIFRDNNSFFCYRDLGIKVK